MPGLQRAPSSVSGLVNGELTLAAAPAPSRPTVLISYAALFCLCVGGIGVLVGMFAAVVVGLTSWGLSGGGHRLVGVPVVL